MNTRDWRTGKFGKPEKLIKITDEKKNGEKKKFPTGFFEDGNTLYKVTVSPGKKDRTAYWVCITEYGKAGQQRRY